MSVTPAEIILRRRGELGLSQAQLAGRIGRAASTIRRWERGEAKPPTSIMPALASALQVAPRDLAVAFGVEDDGTPAPEIAATPDVAVAPPPAPKTESAPPSEPSPEPDREQPITEKPTEALAVQTAVAAPPQQKTQRRSPLRRAPALDPSEGLSYVETTRQRVRYWLRAALTIIVGVILVIILFWALGELGAALSDVWDLFGDEAPPGTAPGTDF